LTPTICVDFDGTLHDGVFPNLGKPMPGAKEALALFRAVGFYIVVFSCRTAGRYPLLFGYEQGLAKPVAQEMKQWLDRREMSYDEIDDGTLGKPIADYYIDDRAIRFNDNWPQIATYIERERERNVSSV
jgi:hypothetical protein